MSDLIFTVAEKIVKIIAAAILNEASLLDANEIASLCASFFCGKGSSFA